jgi:hypothetical protein
MQGYLQGQSEIASVGKAGAVKTKWQKSKKQYIQRSSIGNALLKRTMPYACFSYSTLQLV